jgi:hypothetical protein
MLLLALWASTVVAQEHFTFPGMTQSLVFLNLSWVFCFFFCFFGGVVLIVQRVCLCWCGNNRSSFERVLRKCGLSAGELRSERQLYSWCFVSVQVPVQRGLGYASESCSPSGRPIAALQRPKL